jgi:ribulose-phosphate 3-epimerase
MKIIPAIIPESFLDLQAKLSRLSNLVRAVQVDVCDGKLTGDASWPYVNDKAGDFRKILDQEQGLPLWDRFDFEMDMMVRYPEQEDERWVNAGATRIVIHHHLGQHERTKKILKELDSRNVEGSIAFHFDHSLEEIYKYTENVEDNFNYLKSIQLMGIKIIGYQGQPFEEEILEKIKLLRAKYPNSEIAIDGGVNMDTAERITDAGADKLIIGSALYKSGDIEETLNYFKSL